ncbi:MAG: DUF885 domain-containing protein [Bryobacteraceae bacterium]
MQAFSSLVEEFVFATLDLSPVSATGAGYHRHAGRNLDELLDDYSPAGIARQRSVYQEFRARLVKIPTDGLAAQDRADLEIIGNQIALVLLELDVIQSWKHNPTLYVELVGNALFNPLTLEYAPKPERIRHIIARLKLVPGLLDQAKANLESSPEIWTRVAIDENKGNLSLVDEEIRRQVPPELESDYKAAATIALDSLRAFETYLTTDLARKNNYDWRMGEANYNKKFPLVFTPDRTPGEVLRDAENDIRAVHSRMAELAKPLVPGQASSGDPKALVRKALDKIAQRHATPQTYMADARRDLDEARQFARQKDILALPARDNLQVIDTPEFMRGIYAVGGFNPAPALEPKLGAFYWLTPIPKDWPPQRVESKLREYNFYKLKLLTIHEAMPGHYVQFEYANDVQPKPRRVLRSIFGNGPYIEGWAQYITEVILDEGYLGGSPELRLTFLKEELRVLANAILDIRLHSKGMTDEEALKLMMEETFQEREEATAKLQRAKLSSCQLPTYLVGWREWRQVRQRYQKAKGSQFRLSEFHRKALEQGAVPMNVLEFLM